MPLLVALTAAGDGLLELLAQLVEERELGGPYRSVGDLARVAGFGPSRVRGLSGRVRV